ncbi:hypothetical protein COLO4_29119 [Corchorus olitorius]|uniref:MULE transposase domain-containing protein n=1 Tax=Corchorus olitorius TaxID=93759 RepID=A0A1R3HG67_9ROSI|nr:hypothetical protein COLO4_29119 [Corchorus olitorius]
MIKEKLVGNYIEEFGKLWDYANELLSKNPVITMKVGVTRTTPDSPPIFKRFYVCFAALKNGWKAGSRKIFGVDGCFLKGPFQGELLTTVGKDANDQMYPVAWAVVEKENTDVWTWFFNLLRKDLDLEWL